MGGGGGAWKVAFADFVTAMMALFMLLWILNQDEKVKGEVQQYFNTRFKSVTKMSVGIIPIQNKIALLGRSCHWWYFRDGGILFIGDTCNRYSNRLSL